MSDLASPRAASFLARVGAPVRRGALLVLATAGLAAAVAAEAPRPRNWRRPVRSEFHRSLRQSVGGALLSVLVTGCIVGLGLVFQALYWLGVAGQGTLVGRVLVLVLVRELAPLLIGFFLLGRSGTVATVELGELAAGGEVRALEAQGLDPFLLLVLPRAVAFAAAGFALGVLFVAAALLSGYFAGSAFGAVNATPPEFLDNVLRAMSAADFVVFPFKLVLIGLAVAATAAITGLAAGPGETATTLLPRGFVRGILAILVTNFALTAAA